MVRKLIQITIGLLTFIAFSNIASATSWLGYQPEIPKDLME